MTQRKPTVRRKRRNTRAKAAQAATPAPKSAADAPQQPSSPDAPPRNWATLSTAERVREMERLAPTEEYACMMHPDVRQAQEGVCPKCGMTLMLVKPSVLDPYKLALTSRPLSPKPGEKVRLRFVVTHPRTGARVRDYVLNHEKLFHLFVVSQDMNEYQHIHPQLEADGSFAVETVLPRTGLYKLHADFFPVGGTLQIQHRELSTAGYRAHGAPPPAALTPDASLTKTVDGMTINLTLGADNAPAAGVLVPLTYRLTDARTGEPVRDLEPYLGAWGHTLILNADQSEYLHSHPTETLPVEVDHASLRGGPEVEFRAMFPAPGDYRIWTQFQRAGRVTTVSFTIRVRA
ncbi:MAG TPA: heavy metal-binding domain-containing protein [Pyrinomonadaceae bacterium]